MKNLNNALNQYAHAENMLHLANMERPKPTKKQVVEFVGDAAKSLKKANQMYEKIVKESNREH